MYNPLYDTLPVIYVTEECTNKIKYLNKLNNNMMYDLFNKRHKFDKALEKLSEEDFTQLEVMKGCPIGNRIELIAYGKILVLEELADSEEDKLTLKQLKSRLESM